MMRYDYDKLLIKKCAGIGAERGGKVVWTALEKQYPLALQRLFAGEQ